MTSSRLILLWKKKSWTFAIQASSDVAFLNVEGRGVVVNVGIRPVSNVSWIWYLLRSYWFLILQKLVFMGEISVMTWMLWGLFLRVDLRRTSVIGSSGYSFSSVSPAKQLCTWQIRDQYNKITNPPRNARVQGETYLLIMSGEPMSLLLEKTS